MQSCELPLSAHQQQQQQQRSTMTSAVSRCVEAQVLMLTAAADSMQVTLNNLRHQQ